MSLNRWMTVGIVATSVCIAGIGSSWAQPQPRQRDDDDHRGVATYRKDFRLVDPRGQQVRDNYTRFRFVVPGIGQVGTFYTHENTHYYTPYQASGGPGRPQSAQRPVAIQFGSFRYHEELTDRLVALTKDLCLEMHHNYRDNRGFNRTYAKAYELMETAKFLNNREQRGDHRAMQRSSPKLDSLFHDVESDVRDWRSSERRSFGRMSLPARMEEMEAVIHHLLFDLGVKPDHNPGHDHDPRPNDRDGNRGRIEPPPPRSPRP